MLRHQNAPKTISKLTVVVRDGPTVDAAGLWEFVGIRVPDFGRPRDIEFRAELPRNAAGRVQTFLRRDDRVTLLNGGL